jgi:hypothetical protein
VIRELPLLWTRFTPLESRLLHEVRRALPAAAGAVIDAQVAAINHVQRLPPSWSEIDFYRLRWRKPDWSGVPLFPCTGEVRLAETRFHVAGRRYTSTLSCIDGHIFDLMTTPGPRSVAFAPWDAEPVTILLVDPLDAGRDDREREALPPEWREFIRRHPGQPPAGWTFHDEQTARRVVLDDGVYLVLAESERPAFVLHRLEPPGAYLFYLSSYDAEPERLDLGKWTSNK